MKLGAFIESATESVDRGGLEVLDLELKIEDRLTGEFYDVDEVAINARQGILNVIINSGADTYPDEINGERLHKFGSILADEITRQRSSNPDLSDTFNLLAAIGVAGAAAKLTPTEQIVVKNLGRADKLKKLVDPQILLDTRGFLQDYIPEAEI